MSAGSRMPIFTHPATRVLYFAREEAKRAGQTTIGTEHLLLGLVKEVDGAAARVLRQLGVNTARIQSEMSKRFGVANRQQDRAATIILSPEAKSALEHAAEEARELNPRFGLHYVCTEYILLGLMRKDVDRENRAIHLLTAMQIAPERVREEVLSSLAAGHLRHSGE